MREEVISGLKSIRQTYVDMGLSATLSNDKVCTLNINAKDARITVRLYTEPLETSYFNIDVEVIVNDEAYIYIGSEREYDEVKSELSKINKIIENVLSQKYNIFHRNIFLFWKNTYMRIAPRDNEVIELLKTKQ